MSYDQRASLVGANARRIRTFRGMTQEGVALWMAHQGHKWTQATLARVESSERELRVSELLDLAHILEVGPAALYANQLEIAQGAEVS